MYDKSKLGNASQQSLTSSIGNLTISHSSRESLGDMKEGPPRQMSPLGRISGDAKRSSFDREKFARRRIELEREKEEIEGGEAPAAEADDGVPGGGAADVTLTVNEMGAVIDHDTPVMGWPVEKHFKINIPPGALKTPTNIIVGEVKEVETSPVPYPVRFGGGIRSPLVYLKWDDHHGSSDFADGMFAEIEIPFEPDVDTGGGYVVARVQFNETTGAEFWDEIPAEIIDTYELEEYVVGMTDVAIDLFELMTASNTTLKELPFDPETLMDKATSRLVSEGEAMRFFIAKLKLDTEEELYEWLKARGLVAKGSDPDATVSLETTPSTTTSTAMMAMMTMMI